MKKYEWQLHLMHAIHYNYVVYSEFWRTVIITFIAYQKTLGAQEPSKRDILQALYTQTGELESHNVNLAEAVTVICTLQLAFLFH